jgi:hypothetical protein
LDGPFADLMERIMSKSTDSSTPGRATQDRELRDGELQEVSGGTLENTLISSFRPSGTGKSSLKGMHLEDISLG